MIALAALLLLVGALVGYTECRRWSVDGPLLRLRPEDVNRIELAGTTVNDRRYPGGDPLDIGTPHVIRDPAEIAYILDTLQKSEPHWRIPGGIGAEGQTDAIEIFTRASTGIAGVGVNIDASTVMRDYGPEVKNLYERYRQRTWAQVLGYPAPKAQPKGVKSPP